MSFVCALSKYAWILRKIVFVMKNCIEKEQQPYERKKKSVREKSFRSQLVKNAKEKKQFFVFLPKRVVFFTAADLFNIRIARRLTPRCLSRRSHFYDLIFHVTRLRFVTIFCSNKRHASSSSFFSDATNAHFSHSFPFIFLAHIFQWANERFENRQKASFSAMRMKKEMATATHAILKRKCIFCMSLALWCALQWSECCGDTHFAIFIFNENNKME